MEDAEIVRLYLERSQSAIEETDLKYGAKLHYMAMRILENYEDAQECRNDTYMKAWTTIPPQIPKFLYAYLVKICRFMAFRKLDWKQAQKRSAHIVALSQELETCIPSPGVEETLEMREIGKLLDDFLDMLPARKRQIFMRRYWFAEPITKIAEDLEMKENTVKSELLRMRKKLREYLESEGISL